jgi:hypothetical protein
MSMLIPLQKTLRAIGVTLDRRSRAYDVARPQYRELAPYASPKELLHALGPSSPLTECERDALIAAVLTEHQRAPEPVWQSILLVAFEPMLVRIRRRIRGERDAEDRDQQVLLGFLEALRSVRAGPYMVLAMQWVTKAHAFGAVRKDLRERAAHDPYDDDRTRARPLGATAVEKVAATEIMQMVEAAGGEELLQAIVATEGGDEPLSEYVARVHPQASLADRAKIHDRLSRVQNKVMREIRRRVAHAPDCSAAETEITTAA